MQGCYKVVLLGAKGCGKTTLISFLRNKKYTGRYIVSSGIDVYPIPLQTSYETVILNLWDTPAQEKPLHNIFFQNAHACIGMYDNTPYSIDVLKHHLETLGDIPVLQVRNKADLTPHIINENSISLKNGTGVSKMIKALLSKLNINK
jgi:GTPase SAR1 family protein